MLNLIEIFFYLNFISKGINCWLKQKNNYFSQKKYWVGSYECCSKDCPKKFKAEAVKNKDSTVDVKVVWKTNGEHDHEKFVKDLRVAGEERAHQKLLVTAHGATNTKTDNSNFNFKNENPSKTKFTIIMVRESAGLRFCINRVKAYLIVRSYKPRH